MRQVKIISVIGVVSVTAVAGLAAGPAAAVPTKRPAITVTVASSGIDAGSAPSLTYSAARLPSGAKLLVQRQFGSAGVWKKIATLPATSGTFTAPPVPQGRYVYRIAAVKKGTVLAAKKATLYAYAPVTLETFLNRASSTTQIGDRLFRYVITWTGLSSSRAFTAEEHTCRHLTLDAGLTGGRSTSALVTVVQEAADPATLTIAKDEVRTLDVGLAPGAFEVTHSNSAYGFLNGTLSCYTPNGQTS